MNDVDDNITLDPDQEAFYPIRTVSSATGVNATTLRAWERRYGLIEPHRTETGHRLYTEENINTIKRITQLIEQGIPISRVKSLLVEGNEIEPVINTAHKQGAASHWEDYKTSLLEAVSQYNDLALATAFDEATTNFPIDIVIQYLLVPLLRTLQAESENSGHKEAASRTAFFHGFLQTTLATRFQQECLEADGHRVLLCQLPGELSIVESYLLGISLARLKLHPLFFADNQSVEPWVRAAEHCKAKSIIFVGTHSIDSATVSALEKLPAEFGYPIFVFNCNSTVSHEALRHAGVIPLTEDIPQAVRTIRDIVQS